MVKVTNIALILVLTHSVATTTSQKIPNTPRSFFDYSSQPIATVSQNNDLCQQELTALQARRSQTNSAFKKFMNVELAPGNIPSIGVACSGGGLRAAIATLGVLRGLEKIGLLDAVDYTAGLSGSTWTLASWFVHDKSLDQLTDYIKAKTSNTTIPENFDLTALIHDLISKIKDPRQFSFNDIWGGWLAGIFFGTGTAHEHTVMLADIAPKASTGLFPMPLFSSVIGQTAPSYDWVEFSPFRIGSQFLNAWINPSDFGKKFDSGTSFDSSQIENFGFLLGLFGSAYAASVTDVIEVIKEELKKFLNNQLSWQRFSLLSWLDNIRISPPTVCNFAHNLQDCPLANEQYLTFVDAGLAFNIPFPPLFRRNIQIYIICDASADVLSEIGNDMHKVQDYAHRNNYPFPPIDYSNITTKPISVFADPANAAIPVIIYLPNFQSFSTLKSSYSSEEFDRLLQGMENAVTENVDVIKEALALKIVPNSRSFLTSLPAGV